MYSGLHSVTTHRHTNKQRRSRELVLLSREKGKHSVNKTKQRKHTRTHAHGRRTIALINFSDFMTACRSVGGVRERRRNNTVVKQTLRRQPTKQTHPRREKPEVKGHLSQEEGERQKRWRTRRNQLLKSPDVDSPLSVSVCVWVHVFLPSLWGHTGLFGLEDVSVSGRPHSYRKIAVCVCVFQVSGFPNESKERRKFSPHEWELCLCVFW